MTNTQRLRTPGGSLMRRIILFSLPLMAMNVLQLLFNAADMVVVGRFAGSGALAAVGSTGALISLLTNTFIGMSVGTNVVAAQDYGAGDEEGVNRCLHSSLIFSGVVGIIILAVGIIFCRPLLVVMGTPENILADAVLYMRIYFIGVPANLLYNFGASALRAIGDSKNATIYLIISGVINVLLNLIFVIVFHMTVDGVAWATIISQYLSLILLMRHMMLDKGCMHFSFKALHIDWAKMGRTLRIGVPAGLQSAMFSISNVLIQSSINSFGSDLVAGNSAAGNIEGFVGTTNTALTNAAITYSGQAVGAGDYKQLDAILRNCIVLVVGCWAVICGGAMLFGEQLLGIYVSEPEVIAYGMTSLRVRMMFMFLTGIMNVVPGVLRGMGYSFMPMVNTIIFTCAMRIVWLFTFFKWFPTVEMLFMCYPVTWGLASISQSVTLFIVRRREFKRVGLIA